MSEPEIEEEPLDPTLERVRQRLMRLMLVSIGTLMIGIFVVLGVVIYRINSAAESEAAQRVWQPGIKAVETSLQLGAGEKVMSYEVSQDKMVIEVGQGGALLFFVVVDLPSGEISAVLKP